MHQLIPIATTSAILMLVKCAWFDAYPAKSQNAHAGKWIRWIPDVQVSKKGHQKKRAAP